MSTVKFPYYSGNIKFTKALGHVTISQFTHAIGNPHWNTERIINDLKTTESPQLRRQLKQRLFSFTPAVWITKGLKRSYKNVDYFTGLMQIDLDGINDLKIAEDLKQWVFAQPECVCSFLSPSGNVKALIRIDNPTGKEEYKLFYNAVQEKYDETGYFDEATKNAVLPMFISVDRNILKRQFSQAEVWTDKKRVQIEYTALHNHPTSTYFDSNEDGYARTMRILKSKINDIVDNGHPQVRSAALILGSRVGAGYVDKMSAMNEIVYLIQSNNYLQKGVEGYISTARWGIEEGMKSPKYY